MSDFSPDGAAGDPDTAAGSAPEPGPGQEADPPNAGATPSSYESQGGGGLVGYGQPPPGRTRARGRRALSLFRAYVFTRAERWTERERRPRPSSARVEAQP